MGLFRQAISVKPNEVGYLYKENKFKKILIPGIYKFFDLSRKYDAVILPTMSKLVTVTNQEVITKDNISLRISYILEYQITDGDVFVSKFNVLSTRSRDRSASLIAETENLIHNYSQVYLRQEIAKIESQELNDRRQEVLNTIPEELQHKLNSYGISVHQLIIKDIYFPKAIQQLFARQLETKIRAKLELENAKTTVAATRALKNAAELIKNNESIKFIQYLETISKIASQGKHTFVIGDIQNQNLDR